MKGLYFSNKQLNFSDHLDMPQISPSQSLVKIEIAGICNTDKEIIKGYKPDFTGILGHEFVGLVEKSNDSNLLGKRVVGELNAGCGKCYYCQKQLSRHCENRQIIGMTIDGCFAEYMAIETELLHLVPDSLPSEKAVYTEPLAAAFSIVDTGHIKPTDEVAVLGDGRLAFMVSQVIGLMGSKLTIIGRHHEKLERFSFFSSTLLESELEKKDQFDVVIDATGSPSGMKTAIQLVRSFGEIVVKSTYADQLCLDFSEIVVREIKLRGSRCGPFEPAITALNRNLIKLPEIDLFNLEDYKAAFESRAFKTGFKIS